MRIKAGLGFAAVLAVAMLPGGTAASAQEAMTCTPGVAHFFGTGVTSKKNAPYSATLKTTFEQKLADGNTIRSVSVVHQARDSSGKSRTETIQDCFRGEDGQIHIQMNIRVSDPGGRATMNWETGGPSAKVVRIFRSSDMPVPPKRTPEEVAEMLQWSRLHQSSQRAVNHEDLGIKNIAGANATGSRITRTIRPGEEGNDMPLVTINERWEARDLGITMLVSDEDPRRGKWTVEVTELTRGEPDPALFAAPKDYRVEEQKTVTTVVPATTP